MQIITVFLAIMMFIVPLDGHALKIKVPKRAFFMNIEGKYGRQWIRYFKEGNKWICQTESMPYAETKRAPLTKDDLSPLKKALRRPEKNIVCKDYVTIVNSLSKSSKNYWGCKKDKIFHGIVQKLNRVCR